MAEKRNYGRVCCFKGFCNPPQKLSH
jgi:hypothetical protein